MENKEEILDALNLFEKKPASDIPPLLEEYLCLIAKTGETHFPWPKLKPLFMKKLDKTMCKFFEEIPTDNLPPYPNVENVKFEDMRKRILESVDIFTGAPFTIQRLCELVTNPKKHYKRTDKFLRGIEKNVIVVSTVDPFGRKVNTESKPMINGMDTPNNSFQESAAYNSSSPFAPPAWYSHSTAPPPNWNVKIDTVKATNENGLQGYGDHQHDQKSSDNQDAKHDGNQKSVEEDHWKNRQPESQSPNVPAKDCVASGDSPSTVTSGTYDQKSTAGTAVMETSAAEPSGDLQSNECVPPASEQESDGAGSQGVGEINKDMTVAAKEDTSSSSSSESSDSDSYSGVVVDSETHDIPASNTGSGESQVAVQSQEDVSTSVSVTTEPAAAAAAEIGVSASLKSKMEDDDDDQPPAKRLRENSPPLETSSDHGESLNYETKEQSELEAPSLEVAAVTVVSGLPQSCAEDIDRKSEESLPVIEPELKQSDVMETQTLTSEPENKTTEVPVGMETCESANIEMEQVVDEVPTPSENLDTPSETTVVESPDKPVEAPQSEPEVPHPVDSMETAGSSETTALPEQDRNVDNTPDAELPTAAEDNATTAPAEQDSEKSQEEAMDQD